MNSTHTKFFERPEGKPFRDVLTQQDLIGQYELLSRIELPALQAAVWSLEPLLEKLDDRNRNFAIQSSGALIGDILSARGFRVARDKKGEKRRGRVRKTRFVTTGTIWEKLDAPAATDERVRSITDDLLVRYRSTLETLAR